MEQASGIPGSHREVHIKLGVLEVDDHGALVGFQEKPCHGYLASMGLYVFEPEILQFIPDSCPFGFDDLMHVLMVSEAPVYAYTHPGY